MRDTLTGFFTKAPCVEPIHYNLGTFDIQFNISKNYFEGALTDAETIWEKPLGKELFVYTPTDSSRDVLKINLIYDYRQQATSKLASLGITPDKEVVTHCQSHHRSGLTYLLGRILGFPNIRAYPGSWSEWGNSPETPVITGANPS